MLGKFALAFGIVFIAVGMVGFVPPLVPNGNLLGVFPVNAAHNALHIVLGVWGLAVAKSAANSLMYARGLTVIYGLLTVLGLVPTTNTLFGLAPIGGLDVALHAVLALASAYVGFGDLALGSGAWRSPNPPPTP